MHVSATQIGTHDPVGSRSVHHAHVSDMARAERCAMLRTHRRATAVITKNVGFSKYDRFAHNGGTQLTADYAQILIIAV